MAKYLDQTGLKYFWGKIKGFVNSHEHPVGSVYITISSSFNPANQWGGTWSKIAEGQCLIQAGNTYALGSTGGEATHILSEGEMPSHEHSAGSLYDQYKLSNKGVTAVSQNANEQFLYIDKSTQGKSNILRTNPAGSGSAHNNMPPYLAVNIWKRTA